MKGQSLAQLRDELNGEDLGLDDEPAGAASLSQHSAKRGTMSKQEQLEALGNEYEEDDERDSFKQDYVQKKKTTWQQ